MASIQYASNGFREISSESIWEALYYVSLYYYVYGDCLKSTFLKSLIVMGGKILTFMPVKNVLQTVLKQDFILNVNFPLSIGSK